MIPSRQDNPFATCWTKPGALPYAFMGECCVDDLLNQLRATNWWGQIVGPHGAGKSTLLAELVPAMRDKGREVLLVELRNNQRQLPTDFWLQRLTSSAVVIVDGYEQLSWWQRWHLKSFCRRANCGLLVTTHTDAGLPLLARLSPDLPTVQKLVRRLGENVPHAVTDAVTESDVAASFRAHDGNVREIFFDLYDRHDRRVRQIRTSRMLNS